MAQNIKIVKKITMKVGKRYQTCTTDKSVLNKAIFL